MIRIISALLMTVAASLSLAAQPLQLADNAPARHVVVPGDTLWSISSKFLKEPYRWPELWKMNRDQIRNPNLIYPGNVIVLARDAQGNPVLSVQQDARLTPQVYSEQIKQAIPPIPPNVIEPFISEPLIIEPGEFDSAPRIAATAQDRVFVGAGERVYVAFADPKIEKWQVYRRGKELYDPQTEDKSVILGYEAFYLGTATQIKPGQPATFEITSAKQEIGPTDRLVPAKRPMMQSYIPHKPDFMIDGRIIAVYGGVGAGGRGSIVSINRGSKDGLEIGHVLTVERNRVINTRNELDQKVVVPVPDERVGLVFIFRTFDMISYGLIVQSEGTTESNFFVRTP